MTTDNHFLLASRASEWICLGAALLLIGAIGTAHLVGVTQGYYEPDPNGYVMSAKQMAQHHTLRFDGRDLLRFHDHMWVEWSRNDVYAKYPPGYPLFLALAWLVGGDRAIFWVSPLCGMIGLLASYLLFRKMVPPGLALVGLACFTINPVLALYDGYVLSHAASFAVVTGGMLLLWNWWEKGGLWRAALAGVVLGYAPLIRYTDALIIIPVGAVVLLKAFGIRPGSAPVPAGDPPTAGRRSARVIGESAVMVGGALLCLVPLMAHHLAAFGNPLRTGYSFSGEQQAFEWVNLKINLPVLAHHLNDIALFMVFPVAILGFVLLAIRRRWEGAVLVFWVVPMVVVYGAYYWAPSHGGPIYVRFQMSTFAAYVMAAMYFFDVVLVPRWTRIIIPAGFLVFLGASVWQDTVAQLERPRHSAPLETAAQETTRLLPADAVILAEAPVNDYLQTIRNFTVYKLDYFNPGYAKRILERHESEPMRQKERAEKISAFLNQDLDHLTELKRQVVGNKLKAGTAVALLVMQRSAPGQLSSLGRDFESVRLSTWQSPYVWPWWSKEKPVWELHRITARHEEQPKPAP